MKAVRRFEKDRTNLDVCRDVQMRKDKSDNCCEAYSMLLEAITGAVEKELDTTREAAANKATPGQAGNHERREGHLQA